MRLLDKPNIEDALVPEIAAQFVQDRAEFEAIARAYTLKYGYVKEPPHNDPVRDLLSGTPTLETASVKRQLQNMSVQIMNLRDASFFRYNSWLDEVVDIASDLCIMGGQEDGSPALESSSEIEAAREMLEECGALLRDVSNSRAKLESLSIPDFLKEERDIRAKVAKVAADVRCICCELKSQTRETTCRDETVAAATNAALSDSG